MPVKQCRLLVIVPVKSFRNGKAKSVSTRVSGEERVRHSVGEVNSGR